MLSSWSEIFLSLPITCGIYENFILNKKRFDSTWYIAFHNTLLSSKG